MNEGGRKVLEILKSIEAVEQEVLRVRKEFREEIYDKMSDEEKIKCIEDLRRFNLTL